MKPLVLISLWLTSQASFSQGLNIIGARFAGDGCDPTSAIINISPDQKAFTISFSNYFVELRADAQPDRAKKVCNAILHVNSEPGWKFSIAKFDIRGFANVENGAIVRQRAAFAFDGRLADIDAFRIAGPYNDNFLNSVDLTVSNRNVWSPCDRSNHRLSIRTGLVVKASPGSGGFIAADSIDGEFTQNFGLIWKRCNGLRN